MRVVIDTNVLISALLRPSSLPAYLILLWREGLFDVLTARMQIDELMRVTRYPKIRERLTPALAGRLINQLKDIAIAVEPVRPKAVSTDPDDDYLLAIAAAGRADFLVTGDHEHILVLGRHDGTKILTTRQFLTLQQRLPPEAAV